MNRSVQLLAVVVGILCSAASLSAPMGSDDARHLLNRSGFGARPAEIAEFSALSREQAVDRLLQPTDKDARTPVPDGVAEYVPPSRFRRASDDEKRELIRSQFMRGADLRAWWLTEMLAADTPAAALRERMTLFWHNHFVSSLQKVKSTRLMLEQNRLLRRNALGNFAALLHAVSKDPAMLVYLDSATNRQGQPNENFAREVMELFTLGEGHYSERDIKEAARAFTGWSIAPDDGSYKWRPFFHDYGEKTVLGHSGHFDGDDVLDILLAQPQTAEFVTAKLWREFVAPDPDPAEVSRIAARFRASGYDIRTALRELFLCRAFWAGENRAILTKSPADLVVGTLRTMNVSTTDMLPFAMTMRQFGQDLFAPPNVKGWPGGEAWITSDTLLARKQFADRLFRDDAGLTHDRAVLHDMMAKGDRKMGDEGRMRFLKALDGIRFDAGAWQHEVDAVHLSPQSVLLAAAPVETPAPGMRDIDLVRALALDPAYQLK